MIITNLLLFIAGIATLLIGGEYLVRGSSRLAKALGINPIIIGLTVIAFGTSAPEFVVSLIAAMKGSSDIAIGNIIGSNISNIGLILGLTAMISPIFVNNKLLRVKLPLLIGFTALLIILSLNQYIGKIDGGILFISFIGILVYFFLISQKSKKFTIDIEDENINKFKQLGFIIFGIVGLTLGAHLLVDKTIFFARLAGVSELIIAISAVAIGTSLPELTASIIAARKKEHELILGNIIGSNIFNIGILGLVALIKPINVNPAIFSFEIPAMAILTLCLLPILKTDFKLSRVEGGILLALYIGFILLLFR